MANYYVYKMEIYIHTMNKYEDFIYVCMKKNQLFFIIELTAVSADQDQDRERDREASSRSSMDKNKKKKKLRLRHMARAQGMMR